MQEEKFDIIVQIISEAIRDIEYFAEENEIDKKDIYEELQKVIKSKLDTKVTDDLYDIPTIL